MVLAITEFITLTRAKLICTTLLAHFAALTSRNRRDCEESIHLESILQSRRVHMHSSFNGVNQDNDAYL